MRNPQPEREAQRRPDVFAVMRAEHQAVLDTLVTLEASAERIASIPRRSPSDEDSVRAFTVHLEAQFATHMRSEDEVIYPVLESALPGALQSIAPLRGEHEELRSMLESLRATLAEKVGAVRNEQVAIQVQDLADLLRIHIRKEEAVVFAVAEQLLRPEELTALGARLARMSSTPATPTPRRSRRVSKG